VLEIQRIVYRDSYEIWRIIYGDLYQLWRIFEILMLFYRYLYVGHPGRPKGHFGAIVATLTGRRGVILMEFGCAESETAILCGPSKDLHFYTVLSCIGGPWPISPQLRRCSRDARLYSLRSYIGPRVLVSPLNHAGSVLSGIRHPIQPPRRVVQTLIWTPHPSAHPNSIKITPLRPVKVATIAPKCPFGRPGCPTYKYL
jgi:hypothetical protein